MEKQSIVCLIPARSGSSRVKDKNIRELAGCPLMVYSIELAHQSGIFDDVIVSTDSELYAEIAQNHGASVPFLRPAEFAGERSPDVEWVRDTLHKLATSGRHYSHFCLLRPTNPFRKVTTLQRAWDLLRSHPTADTLRAVEPCKEHPGKMWVLRHDQMLPLLPYDNAGVPWHNNPYQSLPAVYVQNAALEMAKVINVTHHHSITGSVILPLVMDAYEGFDINTADDWDFAEFLLAQGRVVLPEVLNQVEG